MDDASPELADAIYRERVIRARKRTFAQKILAGGDLFDDVCERMKSGIQNQFPNYNQQQVLEELRRRLAIARRLEYKR